MATDLNNRYFLYKTNLDTAARHLRWAIAQARQDPELAEDAELANDVLEALEHLRGLYNEGLL